MAALRVISWNILNDSRDDHYTPQAKRLEEIALALSQYFNSDIPTIAHLSEVTDGAHIAAISKLIDEKTFASDPVSYSQKEWMGFISNRPGVHTEAVPFPIKAYKHSAQKATFEGVEIYGVHQPYKIFSDSGKRITIAHFLSKSAKGKSPSMIVGDLNTVSIQPSRAILTAKGYKSSMPLKHDAFPNPSYKGKHLPKLTPRLPIDAHYYHGLNLVSASSEYSDASDHPLLVSEYDFI